MDRAGSRPTTKNKEEQLQSLLESIMSRRRDGDGRRGAIVVMATLLVFIAALAFSSSSAYGAAQPAQKAAKKKQKPRVLAFVFRGQLNVIGTNRSDRITLRLKPGNPSRLQVDTNYKRYVEYSFRRSRFDRIVVIGRSGSDAMSIDETYGVFTNSEATHLFGNSGRDLAFVKGLASAESLDFAADGPRLRFMRNGNRVRLAGVERFDLPARGGADTINVNDLSGAGLDRLNLDLGQGGNDVVNVKGSSAANELRIGKAIEISGLGALVRVSRAEAASDKLNVDPGAGTDRVVVEGSAGNDTMSVAPAAVAGHIAVSGGPAGVPIDLVNAEALAIEALGGNDTLNGAIGLAALTQLTMDGGAGNDTLGGGDGNDTLRGGSENDAIDGNRGDDTGFLGTGDDSFTWDPGDGSDRVEGEAGTDTMVFNGAGVAENFDFSANGNRLRFFRNVATITMDVDDTERVDLRALGGIDNTVVNDLSATDVRNIELDLETAIGGGAGDGAVDTTTVNGTAGNDSILIAPNAGAVDMTGLAAALKIEHSEAANDLLNVNGLGGNDTINGSVGLAALIKVGMDGGAGNDVLNGGDGAELLLGSDGNDAIDGNLGNDTGMLGPDNDSFRWDPGDGSDIVEGQAGIDTMVFNGSGGAENFEFLANGGRLRFTRNLGNIVMDVDDTEQVDLRALGGADNTIVNDLSGTDVVKANIDLAGALGGNAGDGAADTITMNGTAGADNVAVAANAGIVDVTGLVPAVGISHSEAANDQLRINTLAGNDDVVVGGGVAGLIQAIVDLGTDE
jgi:Ca2+-binding RTX toxin-like protein